MKKKFLLFILLLEGAFFSNVYAGQQQENGLFTLYHISCTSGLEVGRIFVSLLFLQGVTPVHLAVDELLSSQKARLGQLLIIA